MKTAKILIIFISLLAIGCAGLPTSASLNISAEDVLESEILYSHPMTPWHVFGFSMCKGTAVGFIIFTQDLTIVRYCYLDQGRLVGFEVDIDLFKETREVVYVLQDINEEETESMVRALNRVESGLTPYDQEKPDPS
jgi:hypothetical protein